MNDEPQNNLRVFLCHSNEDKLSVRELYKRLISLGIDVWLDDINLLPGQDWELEIRKAIQQSHIVIICLSQNSVQKIGYVQAEIRRALDIADLQPEGSIFIIPLRLEDCDVPQRLRKWQWVDLFLEDGYEKLVSAIRKRADELKIPVLAISKLLSSIRSAIENFAFKDVIEATTLVDTEILPTETLRELAEALSLAFTQLPIYSPINLVSHSKLDEYYSRLMKLAPYDMVIQIKGLAIKLKYALELFNSGQYEKVKNVVLPIFNSKLLGTFITPLELKAILAGAQNLYVTSCELLDQHQEVISFVDKNSSFSESNENLLMYWVTLLSCKSETLNKLGDKLNSKDIETQIFKKCGSLKDTIKGAKALEAGSYHLRDSKRHKNSIPYLKYSLELLKNNNSQNVRELRADVLYKLALCQGQTQDYESAISTCKQLFAEFNYAETPSIESSIAWGLFEYEYSLRMTKKFDESINTFKQIHNRFNDTTSKDIKLAVSWAFAENGLSYKYTQDYHGAINIFNEVIENYEKLPEGQYGFSVSINKSASDYSGVIAYTMTEKASCLRLLGEYNQALEVYNQVIERFGNNNYSNVWREVIYSQSEKAYTLMKCGNFDQAVILYESIIPNYVEKGIHYYKPFFREAIQGIGYCKLFQAKRAFFNREIDKSNMLIEEAKVKLHEANVLNQNSYILGGLGYITFLQKDYPQAKEYITKAYSLAEGDVWLKEMLADTNIFNIEEDQLFAKMLQELV